MNVFGKLFVIANLAVSVLAAALILFVYTTRTSWHTEYKKAENAALVARSNADSYRELADAAKKKADADVTRIANDLQSAQNELKKTQDALDNAKRELSKAEAEAALTQTNAKAQAQVHNRMQQENDTFKKLLGESNSRTLVLEKEKTILRNRAVEGEIAAASQRERNELLLADNERLTKEVQKLIATGGTGRPAGSATAKNPPLEDLEGIVEASDPQSGFVTITLGANHGIQRGNTLEVFRLQPEGKYLGTIRILDVRSDKAVGKPIAKPSAAIQVGDRVASRILGG